jgi:hypothetical protein
MRTLVMMPVDRVRSVTELTTTYVLPHERTTLR